MKYLCMLLGLISGKWKVKCAECKNLDGSNKCFGHQMPEEMLSKTITCGFWGPKA